MQEPNGQNEDHTTPCPFCLPDFQHFIELDVLGRQFEIMGIPCCESCYQIYCVIVTLEKKEGKETNG